jgi:uncharacterized protein (DUF849 family)
VGQDGVVLLKACLNGARRPGAHDALPITPADAARESAAVVAAGAGAIHVHVRDEDGNESFDSSDVAATLDAIRSRVSVPVGVSTGAWVLPDAVDRVAAINRWEVLPDFASVNFHEDGAVDVATALIVRGVGVESGLWSSDSARVLIDSGLAEQCLRFLLEPIDQDLDVAFKTLAGLEDALEGVASHVPRLLHGFGATAWPVLTRAAELGYDSRIGLEDTLVLTDGRLARDNAELVGEAVEVFRTTSSRR